MRVRLSYKVVNEYFNHMLYFKQLREQSLVDTNEGRTTYDQALGTISHVISAIRAVRSPRTLSKIDLETAKKVMQTSDSQLIFVFRDPVAFERLIIRAPCVPG